MSNFYFFFFLYGSIEESFLYIKICFVVSRMLYLLSYSLKKLVNVAKKCHSIHRAVAMVAEAAACKNVASYFFFDLVY